MRFQTVPLTYMVTSYVAKNDLELLIVYFLSVRIAGYATMTSFCSYWGKVGVGGW